MGGGPTFTRPPFKPPRLATEEDLDAITRVHVEGFTEEPQVHYCYPLRHQYPDDYWNWTRREYVDYLKQPDKYVVHVIDAPDGTAVSAAGTPVGVAVWNLAVLKEAVGDPGLGQRRDADEKRLEAFLQKASKRFRTYFAKWGEQQVNLSALVVHPDFRLRGGGTMLVNWGMKRAQDQAWPVTLCASPMGRLLYEHLGFQTLAIEVVRVEGEEETLESTVMVWFPDGAKQHEGFWALLWTWLMGVNSVTP